MKCRSCGEISKSEISELKNINIRNFDGSEQYIIKIHCSKCNHNNGDDSNPIWWNIMMAGENSGAHIQVLN